jgi:NAD(P)-dependent dehydrogenase (short-subunit alcohol dehydrogenase family)
VSAAIDLRGIRALVTAGAGGAGLAIARFLLGCGARVHVCDVDADAAAKLATTLPEASASVADVGNPSEVDRVFDDARDALGGLDALINNVGIAGPTARAEAVAIADWERTMAVNVGGHFFCARRAIPLLRAAGGGAIVNISSMSARTGLPLRLPYVVSKAAVLSLTTNLARELGPDRIRVNAILPGAIRGARLQRVIDAKAAALGVDPAAYERELLRYVSLRTLVEGADIAAMAAFLISPLARVVTGQLIAVDGNVEWEA